MTIKQWINNLCISGIIFLESEWQSSEIETLNWDKTYKEFAILTPNNIESTKYNLLLNGPTIEHSTQST